LSRRFKTTQIWYRWKRYLGKKDRIQNGKIQNENPTHLDVLITPVSDYSKIENLHYFFFNRKKLEFN
jgi:hypothetical protein